jgi:hypothetical protein
MRASHVRAAWRKLQEAPNPSSIIPPPVSLARAHHWQLPRLFTPLQQ